MAVFSKPHKLTYTCYELGHCWTPFCTEASAGVAKSVFREALKIYGSLYLVAAILRKRGIRYYVKKFVPETLRSSLFLTINGTLFISMFCIWRSLVGYYIFYNVFLAGIPTCMLAILVEQKRRGMLGCVFYLTASFIPAYVAAFTAVLTERKSRRGPLAVYVTNLAIETAYRMLVERGIVTPMPYGEVYLFSAVSAVYLYLFRSKNGLSSASESVFRFFVGKEESASHRSIQANPVTAVTSRDHDNNNRGITATSTAKTTGTPQLARHTHEQGDRPSFKRSALWAILGQVPGASTVSTCWSSVAEWLTSLPRHTHCPHQHSCASYVLKGGVRMFTFGYLVQSAISAVSTLSSLVRRPALVKQVLFSKLNLRLAACLGGYSSIFAAVNCLLRWIRNKDSEIHGAVAGALAGLSLSFYRSVTISLYAATKLVEILYFKGIESCGFPHIPWADVFIYSFSTAFIFHAALLEPHTLRPGYWKFLLRVTDNRFAQINRKFLDVFGLNSSKMYPDYWPDYDPAYTSLTKPNS